MSQHAKSSNGSFHPLSAPDFLPLNQLRDLQLQRLKAIVRRAYDGVALFRQRMDERGVKPEDVRALDDIIHLPFAQKRFCEDNDIRNVVVLSDYRYSSFGINYGLLIKDMGLLTRAVFVVNKDGIITYKQIVPEIADFPDYDAALAAARKASGESK